MVVMILGRLQDKPGSHPDSATASCGMLGNLLSLSEFQFLHLYNGDNRDFLTELLENCLR